MGGIGAAVVLEDRVATATALIADVREGSRWATNQLGHGVL